MSRSASPTDVPAIGDPGDETASRYSYQWTWAAVRACEMLDDDGGVVEIYCEHHEDILLRHRDGTCTGLQVKTQQPGGAPWKSTDQTIRDVLARFAKLEDQFGQHFRCYEIASNHPFLTEGTAGTCLRHVVGLAASAADVASADAKVKAVVRRMATDSDCTEDCCFRCLKKCRLNHDLPKLEDGMAVLERTIGGSADVVGDPSRQQLQHIARSLVDECRRASDLTHEQYLPGYLRGNAAAADQAAIEGKRLTRQKIDPILRSALSATSMLGGPAAALPSAGQSVSRLVQKLDKGGFGINSVNAAQDLRDSALFKSLEWMNKYGEKIGVKRNDHVRRLVQTDCGTAQDLTRASGEPYGTRMREAMRQQLQRRVATATVFDCSVEHLEGQAYALTNECRVWWSEPFALTEVDDGPR